MLKFGRGVFAPCLLLWRQLWLEKTLVVVKPVQPVHEDADNDQYEARQKAGSDPDAPWKLRLAAQQPRTDGRHQVEVEKCGSTEGEVR